MAPNLARNHSLSEVRAAVASGATALLLLSADANAGDPGCVFSNRPTDGQNCQMRKGPGPGGPDGGGFFSGQSEGAPLATLGPAARYSGSGPQSTAQCWCSTPCPPRTGLQDGRPSLRT